MNSIQHITIEPAQTKPVFSVVICSVNKEKYNLCRDNIAATIGVDAEFVRVDNAAAKWPISKAYNNGASVASAPNVLFIHEDVLFENSGWGTAMARKLAEPETGVIGFIGVPFRLGAYAGWNECSELVSGHIYYIMDGQRICWHQEPWADGKLTGGEFAPVLVVDGLGFAVRRDVWQEHPFDEVALDAFHCYDIDFCMQVALTHRNYVYLKADITHFSNGNMDSRWVEQTLRLSEGKWKEMMPMCVPGLEPANPERIMARADYDFLFKAVRGRANRNQAARILRHFIKQSLHSKAYRRKLASAIWQVLIKYHKLPSRT